MDSIPEARRRRSIRLKGYDYSRTGAYFVTHRYPKTGCASSETWLEMRCTSTRRV